MPLAEACTLEQANQVLQANVPRFNAQFAVPAADPALAWQAFPASLTLDECFCWQEERQVDLDNTVSYYKRRLQLLPTQTRHIWARAKVLVYESFDGALRVFADGQCIPSRPAPADPAQARAYQQWARRRRANRKQIIPGDERRLPLCLPDKLIEP